MSVYVLSYFCVGVRASLPLRSYVAPTTDAVYKLNEAVNISHTQKSQDISVRYLLNSLSFDKQKSFLELHCTWIWLN